MNEIPDHVYTYYEPLGNPDSEAVISLWKEAWSAQGWTPVVLGVEDAKRHPAYETLVSRASKWPTLNDRRFEMSCFVRWCAFALLIDYCAIADYDVFPRVAFPPKRRVGFICLDACGGPGFMIGTGRNFQRILNHFLNYTPSAGEIARGHISDMSILHLLEQSRKTFYRLDPAMANYGSAPWLHWPLTHFGNAYLSQSEPRSEQIKKILSLK